ncbi:NADPH-dependent F420 reductase [Sphingomonas sp. MMS24-J45]|uniref:NADPH-dependent F420 reductase n=1 Tax=Sphingomonas sp. MMS24-J45 TaxID=3238806 RepID=UPI00384A76CE
MKIGIIGAGHIGGTLGHLLSRAGHEILYGTRNPTAVSAKAGTLAKAAAFGEVVIFAGPFGAWPDFARDNAAALVRKVLIDASNPYPDRDGPMAAAVVESGRGSAAYVTELLPDSHIVRAFNTIYWIDLRDEAGRPGEKLAMPIAGNDAEAVGIAQSLVRDAGFDPVVVGGLKRSIDLDPGSPIYGKSMTAERLRAELGLAAGTA